MRNVMPLVAVFSLGLAFGVAREAPAQCEAQNLQELAVSNPFDHAAVGSAVALDGTRAVVGAKLTSLSFRALDAGAAYVFDFDGAQWNLGAELLASEPVASQEFGTALAVDGDRIVVGAPGGPAEAAYVFEREAGAWTQVAKLTVHDASIEFGSAVAVDGDVIVVGAPFDSQSLPFAGAAYVFEKVGGTWTQVARLAGSDLVSGAVFGRALALQGDRLIVGSTDAPGVGTAFGAVYVYERLAGTWTQTAKLTPADGQGPEHFGKSVALSGDLIVVGQPEEFTTAIGSAYVFRKTADGWTQEAKLTTPTPDVTCEFGTAVAVVTDPEPMILVGEPFGFHFPQGAVHVFEKQGAWTRVATLASPAAQDHDEYGSTIAASGGLAVVGSPYLFEFSTADTAWLLATCTWKDLGGALVGATGAPHFAGSGTLLEGSHDLLSLTHARRGAAALLFFAPGEPGALPFKGGVLQAGPGAMVLPGVTDSNGSIALGFDAPAGLSGTSMVLQWAIADAGAPAGVALSNGLQGRLP